MADYDNITTANELLDATAMDIDLDVTDLGEDTGMSFGEKAGVVSLAVIAGYALYKGAKWVAKKTGLAEKIAEKRELKKQAKEQAKADKKEG